MPMEVFRGEVYRSLKLTEKLITKRKRTDGRTEELVHRQDKSKYSKMFIVEPRGNSMGVQTRILSLVLCENYNKMSGERLDREQQSKPSVSTEKEIKVKGEVNYMGLDKSDYCSEAALETNHS